MNDGAIRAGEFSAAAALYEHGMDGRAVTVTRVILDDMHSGSEQRGDHTEQAWSRRESAGAREPREPTTRRLEMLSLIHI